jgi:uncharacterized membrane-anchored protein
MSELGFKKPERGMGHGVPENLTDAQKAAMAQAKKLMNEGKPDEAKKILEAAGIKRPQGHMMKGHFDKNLTDTQREVLKQARELFEAGKSDEARQVLTQAGLKAPQTSQN